MNNNNNNNNNNNIVSLKYLNNNLRDLCNFYIVPQWDRKELFLDYTKRVFLFNENNWWNFLCSVMDSISDTSFVIEEYKNNWLWSLRWEKLIRLYWLLNAIFCQLTSIEKLEKILWQEKTERPTINELRKYITHLSDINYWKNAYYFTHKIENDSIIIVEHTNRSNQLEYNLKELVYDFEIWILWRYKKLLKIILNNITSSWINIEKDFQEKIFKKREITFIWKENINIKIKSN